MSALQEAAGMGKTDVVVELVKNGANLNLLDGVCSNVQLHVIYHRSSCSIRIHQISGPLSFVTAAHVH